MYIDFGSVCARATSVSSFISGHILAFAQNAAVQHPSLVVVGGEVWAPGRPRATAVAVEGERISAVGSDADIRSLIGRDTRVIEARGHTIIPAFNDAHVHFLMGSRSLDGLDLFGAETQAEVERRIHVFADTSHSQWLIGRGWYYSAFPGGMPTLEQLDALVPDRPAYVESFDAHTAWINSRAREASGLGPGPGVLKEAAMLDVTRNLPERTSSMDSEALRAGMKVAASHGIASVQEAGEGLDQLPLYRALLQRRQLTMRVRLAFDMVPGMDQGSWGRRLDAYDEAAREVPKSGLISTGILKAFADGVIESRTASLLEPYAGMTPEEPGAFGQPNWEPGELAQAVRVASERGWQVQVHAIGDRAIRDSLDAFAACDRGRRHRVEHIEAPAAADIARFAHLGVIASMQPQHAEPVKNLLEVWAPNLGPERAARGWPWATIVGRGGRLALGTDWPVVPMDPFASVHVAVNRQTVTGEPPGGWLPHERLSREDALAGWTSGSAYAEHMEEHKGALKVGMLADIAVLDRDLRKVPPSEIAGIRVEATVVGGRLVYES
jgi:predicted amidohydrolase YtcJ